jgi:two-component system, chemotaxis family, chemotaxis protein CheY
VVDKSLSVIVADDMVSIRKIIIRALKTDGFEHIIEAADGQEAYKALQTANPPVGLIISDYNMPNCSGFDFLKLVRGNPQYKSLPFIMVTSEAEKGMIVEVIKAGVSSYILKPFTPDGLCEKIRNLKVKTF